MSNKTKHAPGPWYQHQETVQSVNGTMVASLPDVNGTRNANAAFIVRACNAHDDMLAALKAIAQECEAMKICAIGNICPQQIARAAIAKAEE